MKLSDFEFLVGANTNGDPDELECGCLDELALHVTAESRDGDLRSVIDWMSEWAESTCAPEQVRQLAIEDASSLTTAELAAFAEQLSGHADWKALQNR